MLKVSASYLEEHKSFIPKKKFFGLSQYQNKTKLFTDSIFWEGFAGCEILYTLRWKSSLKFLKILDIAIS